MSSVNRQIHKESAENSDKSKVVYLFIVGSVSKPWYLVNTKIAGKWMFIPLKMVSIGIDPYPVFSIFGGRESSSHRLLKTLSTCLLLLLCQDLQGCSNHGFNGLV